MKKCAAVVFRVLIFSCGLLTVLSCSENIEQLDSPQEAPVQALKLYSNELVGRYSSELISYGYIKLTSESPLAFETTFKTSNPEMLTRDGGDIDKEIFDSNYRITSRWQEMYCTEALKELLKSNQIFNSVGVIVDELGKKYSAAFCTVEGDKTPPPVTTRTLKDVGLFSIEQICKAGLSLMYGRETEIMTALAAGDHVQVRYVRPSDGREMSYRCRLERNLILTWDDSLVGARWYGNQSSDSQLKYKVTNKILLIQDVSGEYLRQEETFSPESIAR